MALAASALENAAAGRVADLSRLTLRLSGNEETRIMTRTAHELAKFLACTLEGDGTAQLSGVAAPGSASAFDLIYVEKERHLDRAAASLARCVVIVPGLAVDGKTLLRAANPKLAFAKAAAWLGADRARARGLSP